METSFIYDMHVPTRTLFGAGQLDNLYRQDLPGKNALLVISNGHSTRANGYLARVEEQLSKADIEYTIFDQVESNPLKSTVMKGSNVARLHSCDFVITLGGGSVMDASKAIAAMATNDGDLWDYIFFGTGKGKPLCVRPLPLVAIPTTSGTGSENDSGAVITNAETNEKTAFFSEGSFPVLSIGGPRTDTFCSNSIYGLSRF